MATNLGIYIHVPFCNGKCAYCDFVSGVYTDEIKEAYFLQLQKEIASFNFDGYMVDSVYFGGGTPSSVNAEYVARTLDKIKNIARGAEITVECNPESFDAQKARIYAASGVNRISFGMQVANDKILSAIGRRHTVDKFLSAAGIAKEYFDDISADIMLGLPKQTEKDVEDAVSFAAAHVRHISVYALKVEDGTPLQASGYKPDDDIAADFYDLACARLNKLGYNRYEVSNFALDGSECRHNIKYWNLDEYKGFGVAAHSYIVGCRTENTPSLVDYLNGRTVIESREIIRGSAEDAEEFIMLALRTREGIDLNKFAARFGYRLETEKKEVISEYPQHLIVRGGSLTLAGGAYYLMNKLILELI